MKSKNNALTILCFTMILAFAVASCSTSRKSAIACPEFTKYPSEKVTVKYKKNKNLSSANNNTKSKKHQFAYSKRNETKKTSTINKSFSGRKSQAVVNSVQFNKSDFSGGLIASADNSILPLNLQQICDTILLKSGVALIGKVEEINQKDIRYRKCNNLNGPLISVLKSDIRRIDYANGTQDVLSGDAAETVNADVYLRDEDVFTQKNPPIVKTDGLAVAGFASSVLGLIIAGVILGTIGVIFGAVGLHNVNKNPGRKGRGLAVAAIIIGFIAVIGALIVVSAM